MKLQTFILTISFLFLECNCQDGSIHRERLRSAVILTMHGDRAPLCGYIYPNYELNISHWPNGLNNLTDKGIKKDYNRGSNLRVLYETKFNRTLTASHFRAFVSDVYRSKVSVLAIVKGFLGDRINLTDIKELLDLESIPVLSIIDDLFLDDYDRCENHMFQFVRECQNNGSQFQSYIRDKAKFIRKLGRKSGMSSRWLPYYVFSLVGPMKAEESENRSIPTWVTPQVWNGMTELITKITPKFCGAQSDWFKRTIGLLLDDILNKLDSTLYPREADETPVVYLYATFHYTLVKLFDVLNVSQRYLPFSSQMIFELEESNNVNSTTMSIKFQSGFDNSLDTLYRGDYVEFKRRVDTIRNSDVILQSHACKANRTAAIPNPNAHLC